MLTFMQAGIEKTIFVVFVVVFNTHKKKLLPPLQILAKLKVQGQVGKCPKMEDTIEKLFLVLSYSARNHDRRNISYCAGTDLIPRINTVIYFNWACRSNFSTGCACTRPVLAAIFRMLSGCNFR